jgi:hypothetical protein
MKCVYAEVDIKYIKIIATALKPKVTLARFQQKTTLNLTHSRVSLDAFSRDVLRLLKW